MIEDSLFYALAALFAGAAIAWLWRGAELAEARGRSTTDRETIQELEIEHASLLSERDMVSQHLDTLTQRVSSLQDERNALANSLAAQTARQSAEKAKHREQLALLDESRKLLRVEFENLANRIFEERGKQFSHQNQQSMESLLKPFGEQIRSFQSRINEVHAQSIRGNENLAGELRNMMGVGLKMSDQAENLATALKGDKKTTGNWGEMQLERTLQLAGLENGLHYETQADFRDSSGRLRLPDFVIKLPDGKHLIIDSKVSLVDYERAVCAETEEERGAALKAHCLALRRHIDDLASKDYAALGGIDSPDLVFMFMPIEAAYIEALKYNRELFNDGFRQNIILTSHTTLLPMLRTVAGLWISYRSNEEAREISALAGDIYNKVRIVAERLEDMGKTLSAATVKYNRTVTALVGNQGLVTRVERFKSSAANARGDLPKPDTLHPSIDHDRLASLAHDDEDACVDLLNKK
ncbi:MAG: DNA recombination protein RmuC [Congregibacter sp.]